MNQINKIIINCSMDFLAHTFLNYINQPAAQSYQNKVYRALAGTQLGLFSNRPSSQELLTKFKIMRLHYRRATRKKWHRIQKQILVALLAVTCGTKKKGLKQILEEDWKEISYFMLWTPQQCRNKYLSAMMQLSSKPWTPEEDLLLTQLVVQGNYTAKWTNVARNFNIRSRLNKEVYRNSRSCKERWYNYLDPRIVKGDWTLQDDIQLLSLVLQHGKRWSRLSKKITKLRTQNAIKNRFNSLLRKSQFRGDVRNRVQMVLAQKRQIWQAKSMRSASDPTGNLCPTTAPSTDSEPLLYQLQGQIFIFPFLFNEAGLNLNSKLSYLHPSSFTYHHE